MKRLSVGVLTLTLVASACASDGPSDKEAAENTPSESTGGEGEGFTVWAYEGLMITPETVGLQAGAPTADVSAVSADGGVRAYFMAPGQGLRSLFATDGLNFELEDGVRLAQPPANPAQVVALPDGGYRASFHDDDHDIVSARSDDGLTFEIEDGVRLSASDYKRPDGKPSSGLFMPAISQMADGTWLALAQSAPEPGTYVPYVSWAATSDDGLEWAPDPDGVLGDGTSEHEYAVRTMVRESDDSLTAWFFRQFEIWETTSTDGGATWTDGQRIGLVGADPAVFTAPDGKRRMFFDNFDPAIGGVVGLATETKSTWRALRTSSGPETVVTVEGSSESPLKYELYDMARDTVVSADDVGATFEVEGELPEVTLRFRSQPGEGSAVVIRVSDGTVNVLT